jgi:TPR repeat protein
MPDTDALLRIAYDAAEAGNFEYARRCYESGAALGDAMCLQALGYMYDVGEGVVADKAMAMKLYRKAWSRGSHAAATNIAILYREMGNNRTMFRCISVSPQQVMAARSLRWPSATCEVEAFDAICRLPSAAWLLPKGRRTLASMSES